MELNIGDVVEFKHYEDIDEHDRWSLDEWDFPKIATVSEFYSDFFKIKETAFNYSYGTVKTVHPKKTETNIPDVYAGDEVLVKAHVINVKGKNLMVSWFEKEDVVKVLKHKPEKFIIQDDHYGMYVSSPSTLTTDKKRAHIFNSREEANDDAAGLHLNTWDVIPYDD